MTNLNYKELQEQGVFDIPYKAFEFMQKQQETIDELVEALIKEQDEVLKYKPIYFKMIAENITLKEKFNDLLKEATSSNRLSSFTVISILEGL